MEEGSLKETVTRNGITYASLNLGDASKITYTVEGWGSKSAFSAYDEQGEILVRIYPEDAGKTYTITSYDNKGDSIGEVTGTI